MVDIPTKGAHGNYYGLAVVDVLGTIVMFSVEK